jgi:hypothetical protein
MPSAEELIETTSAEALKQLKKILASRGKLQGNFYFAGDTRGGQAGLVVTLLARDRKGSKATAQGKKLRAELSGAKFARGVVTTKGSKLLFELHSGNATKDHMKLGFKKAFDAPDSKALKALLRRALVAKAGAETEEPEALVEEAEAPVKDGAPPAPDVDLGDALEPGELEALLERQGDLEQRNAALKESFLSAESARVELQESIDTLSQEIIALQQAPTLDLTALQAKRYALAEVLYVGTDPFPEVGQPLPEPVRDVLKAAIANQKLTDWSAAVTDWTGTAEQASRQLDALKTALLADGDPELADIARRDLPDLAGPALTALSDRIGDLDGVSDEERAGALGQVSAQATALADRLAAVGAVAAVDGNPFGVTVTLAADLIPGLRRLAAAARLG